MRKRWLALLLVIGVVVVGISLFDLPFATGSDAGQTVVKVTGGQFFWSLSPGRVPVGSHVRFDVTSVDVNHGFGLYDPHGHLIGSVQAMPGYHNKLDLDLSRCRRLPDPLSRAVRAEPLDDAEHVHGDEPLMARRRNRSGGAASARARVHRPRREGSSGGSGCSSPQRVSRSSPEWACSA